jgi:hypothetical protein
MNKYKWVILSIYAIFPVGVIPILVNLAIAIIRESMEKKANGL